MKNLKIATIATALTALIIALCGITMTASAETCTKIAVVTAWEQIGDTALKEITVTDEDGNLWGFFDDEDYWQIGDLVVITLWDLEEIEEDAEVTDVEKIDHLEWHDLFNWLDKIYE